MIRCSDNRDDSEIEKPSLHHLLTNPLGTAFVRLYYRVSPPFARVIARRPRLRLAVRKTLDLLRSAAM